MPPCEQPKDMDKLVKHSVKHRIRFSGHTNTVLAPMNILAAIAIVTIAAMIVITSLLHRSPWLGVEFARPDDGPGLVIAKVFAGSPAAHSGLSPGDIVLAVHTTPLQRSQPALHPNDTITLQAHDVIDDPALLNRYDEYRRFFTKQAVLFQAFKSGPVTLQLLDGRHIQVTALTKRPVLALPWSYWYQLICAMIALLTAALVVAFQHRQAAARYYALTGLGISTVIFTNSYFSSRELALHPELFVAFSKINWLGVCTLGWGMIGTLWYYPRRISALPFGPLLSIPFVLAFTVDFFEIPASLDVGQRYPLYAGFIAAASLAIYQWRRCRHDPLSRAAMRWFFISWFSGTGAFIVLVLLPLTYDIGWQLDYTLAIGLLPVLQLGIALGIMRYRLFDMDRLSMMIWLWFIGGLLVVILDSILVTLINLTAPVAMSLALLVVGWLYFPLRQLLWRRLGWNAVKVDFQQLFPKLIKSILAASNPQQVKTLWLELLQELYQPLSIKETPGAVSQPERIDHGLRMRIPGFDAAPAFEIYGADRGTRLMGPDDEGFAASLWQLFKEIQEFRAAFEQGVLTERARVARDLHDDIASDLLGLIYQAPDLDTRRQAQRVFDELRVIIQGMESSNLSFSESLSNLRAETEERCRSAGIDSQWRVDDSADILLPSRSIVNLRRAFKEAISNVIKHSQSSTVAVSIFCQEADCPTLVMEIRDNGVGMEKEVKRTRGITNISERLAELGGTARWCKTAQSDSGTTLQLRIPLSPQPPLRRAS